MGQHVSHRRSDEVHQALLDNERLSSANAARCKNTGIETSDAEVRSLIAEGSIVPVKPERLSKLALGDDPLHNCTKERLIAAVEDLHRNYVRVCAERDKYLDRAIAAEQELEEAITYYGGCHE